MLPEYEPATNVHELKPSDIRVTAALGDSITAGYGIGAENVAQVAINNRGYSWSIGGNQSIDTLISIPNLLKKYNSDVTGWSWSRCFGTTCINSCIRTLYIIKLLLYM